ncbi:TetR/AcrR family transcriptional regulator [Mumia quercus]|uniref:TetR/AcrR family transcriptional regulator n=1 Tax=Mumia quercus TaxID=2976125 RepID=UPI0021D38426|nr:TetR/AcrR family transcriptional regulator [Mumia quercus]
MLDAAHAIVVERGVRGLTMADLARRAEVSRATLYRTWPNVEGVVGDLFTREFRMVMQRAMRLIGGRSARDVLVSGTVSMVGQVRRLPLLKRVVELDPDFLLPYLVNRRGRSTDEQLALLEDFVRDGQRDGSIREGDPSLLASAVLLNAYSFALTGPAFVGPDRITTLDALLTELLQDFLRP